MQSFRIFCAFLICLISTIHLHGQNNAIDSLTNLLEIHQEEDTLRVQILVKTAWAMNYARPQEAFTYTEEALEISRNIDYPKGIALGLRQEGNLHFAMANYEESMKCHFAGLKIAEDLGDPAFSASFQNNIGNIYAEIEEPEKALEYYELYLANAKKSEKQIDQVNGLTNIGMLKVEMNNIDEGIKQVEEALELAEKINHTYYVAAINLNLGLSHKINESYHEALKYYAKAGSIAQENGMMHIESLALSNTASINILMEDFEAAKANSMLGLALAEKSNAIDWQTQSWEILSTIHEKTGDYKQAYLAYQNYVALKDSMLTEDKKSELTRIEMQYEMEKQEAVAEEEIKRQKQIKQGAILGFILLLLGSVFAYYSYKKRRDFLELKQVSDFQSKVADTKLMALSAQLNPHFIFNALNSISNCMEKQDVQTANIQLMRFSDLTRSILENSKKRWIELEEDLQMMRDYIELELMRLPEKFKYSFQISEEIDVENAMIPSLIAQPFIENSIWHGLANKEGFGNLKIIIDRQQDTLRYIIEDDGIGREKSKEIHKKRKSMGVDITKSRLEIINAQNNVDAKLEFIDLNPGLRVVILLPFKEQF